MLHSHGRWQEPDSIVLDEDTYRQTVENNDRVKALVGTLLFDHAPGPVHRTLGW